jgi:hypothetical protein
MKFANIKSFRLALLVALAGSLTGCYKLQKDAEYVKRELDPHINKSAKQYLLDRADLVDTLSAPRKIDTIFRWMKKGLEYAEIDLAEFEKPGRTFIFLHNDAVRVVNSSKAVTAGFFFDYPIVEKDASGNPLRNTDGSVKTHPAKAWEEYSKETVRNYFLSLVIQGEYGFNNLGVENTSVSTLLPAGTAALKDSKLGYAIATSDPDPSGIASSYFDFTNGGNGFDPEGKINLKLENNASSPIKLNDRTNNRTAGIFATNGQVHVYSGTVHPFRYSHL